jgi:hypothetical protein
MTDQDKERYSSSVLKAPNSLRVMSFNAATMMVASTVLLGLALLSLASPSAAQQQGDQQMTTNTTATTSPNGTTTISLQELTNNQSITQPIDGFTITQQWSPRSSIDPGTAAISHSSCGEGQFVISGGYQVSNPDVQILFEGPSLSINAYAVQAYNGGSSPSFVQVYSICVSAGEGTPEEAAQALAEQEGSRQ